MKIIKCVLVLVFLAGVVVLSMSCSNARDNDYLRISVTQENPLNMEQHSASIKMGVSDSRLYFSNDNELFFLSNGHLEKIADINANIFALVGDYVYYNMVRPDYSGEVDFYCYSIPDHIQTYLFTTTEIAKNRDVFFQQGNLFIPVDRSCTHFYSVVDGQITDTDAESPKWGICGNTYTFVYKKDEQEFICYRDNESMQTPENVLPYGFETVVECNNGLLIHNEGQGNLLYFIVGDTGELVELFTVDCMRSVSAVNVYQTNIYLSFCRYEKHGQIGMVRYKDDTLEGTYCISLSDYSVKKLSDKIYNGLFIFDDTGIYACDSKHNVYKLDFDGNIITKLTGF